MTTQKQQDFAMRLYKDLQKIAPELSEQDAQDLSDGLEIHKKNLAAVLQGEGNNKAAGQVIDLLLSLIKDVKQRTGFVEYRWTKIGNQFVVVGPNLEEGMEVTVTSRKGEKKVKIGKVVDGNGYPVREEISNNVTEGIWENKDGDYIEVAMTRNGQLVGKSIDENGKRTYLGKRGLVDLKRKLDLSEIKAFGVHTGTCMVCGKKLTNPESIEAGIGPVCLNGWG